MTLNELAKRDERSQDLSVYKINEYDYFVESSHGKTSYKVFLNGSKICTCPDYAHNIQNNPEFVCKHILAALNANGNAKKLSLLNHKPRLDDRWITNIKGKDFVVYSGLLDLAHQIGLQSITVEVEQYPTGENGNEAICRAVTVTSSGQTFEDYGDANPKNTSTMVVNHLIRVASTRAKARTLRDMTNIGMTCLEELGDDDVGPPANTTKVKSNTTSKPKPVESKPDKTKPDEPSGKPSTAQINAIKNLAERRGLNDTHLDTLAQEKMNLPSFQALTANQAGAFIKLLQQAV